LVGVEGRLVSDGRGRSFARGGVLMGGAGAKAYGWSPKKG
jgi:hypothetical protein